MLANVHAIAGSTIEDRLAAAERRIAALEARLGPAPMLPQTLTPTPNPAGIPAWGPLGPTWCSATAQQQPSILAADVGRI